MEDKEVHDLFHRFDQQYFWGKLSKVRLNWSKNMTLCAGKTYCKERRGSKSCAIYLSQPLLNQRPREDTVNTLLHEMIHAYLFVTERGNYKMGHGPPFREHMTRINKLHGSKITVFHNFRKEVDKFRVHVYRCDGPCTKKRPYFGVLRRAITRPPGPTDRWWARHLQECGGTFHKVEGPDITPDSAPNTSKSMETDPVRNPNTPSRKTTSVPEHTPSPKSSSFQTKTPSPQNRSPLTFTPRRIQIPSLNYTPPQHSNPSPKPTLIPKGSYSGTSQAGRMATRYPDARKRLSYDSEENAVTSEDQLVQKIKERHAHTKKSVLLSKEETKMIWRGRSPERGTLVDGRVNYNYRPKTNLNIRKYVERYRAYKEAIAGKPLKAPVFQGPPASPATQKSRHQFSESDASWGTNAAQSSQPSFRDKTQTGAGSGTGDTNSQAAASPCVTCWNCGVNVLVPEHVSQTREGSSTPQKVSVPVEKKVEKSVSSNLVDCPSCGGKVPEEELNSHLDECLMPFTDDF